MDALVARRQRAVVVAVGSGSGASTWRAEHFRLGDMPVVSLRRTHFRRMALECRDSSWPEAYAEAVLRRLTQPCFVLVSPEPALLEMLRLRGVWHAVVDRAEAPARVVPVRRRRPLQRPAVGIVSCEVQEHGVRYILSGSQRLGDVAEDIFSRFQALSEHPNPNPTPGSAVPGRAPLGCCGPGSRRLFPGRHVLARSGRPGRRRRAA